jgi:hypothetical protein
MRKRKKLAAKKEKIIREIKARTPNIIFTANNLIVTLRNRNQLAKWLEIYPDGKYVMR